MRSRDRLARATKLTRRASLLITFVAILEFVTLPESAADYLAGQCVSCSQCPPCSSSGGGGGGGGGPGGRPRILDLLFGSSAEQNNEPKQSKPKYPVSFRAFDEVGVEARKNLRRRLIRHNPDNEFGAKAVSETLVTSAGTTFFSNPAGGDARFLPNPPMLELRAPTTRSAPINFSREQLGYALAITRIANTTSGVSIEDQRFLLDQAGLMLSGQPVQLDIHSVATEAVDATDLRDAKEVFRLRNRYQSDRLRAIGSMNDLLEKNAPLDREHGAIWAASTDEPDTPRYHALRKEIDEQNTIYKRFVEKEKSLRAEYLEKVEAKLDENPTIKFSFGTAIVPTLFERPPVPARDDEE